MEKVIINIYSRKEIEGLVENNLKVYNEMKAIVDSGKRLTDFGEFRLKKSEKNMKKYQLMLDAFPDAEKFSFINGRELVDITIKSKF